MLQIQNSEVTSDGKKISNLRLSYDWLIFAIPQLLLLLVSALYKIVAKTPWMEKKESTI